MVTTPDWYCRWNQGFEWKKSGIRRGLSSGWVIARGGNQPRYLQIATGQWCPPDQATWFPLRSTAEAYLRTNDTTARVVFLVRRSTGEFVEQPSDVFSHSRRRLA